MRLRVVRVAHVLLYGYAANDDGVQAGRARLGPPVTRGGRPAAGRVASSTAPCRAVLGVAIAIDFAPGSWDMENWKLHPGHFAERHGLIVIIAFGESIVATGLGAQGTELDRRGGGRGAARRS